MKSDLLSVQSHQYKCAQNSKNQWVTCSSGLAIRYGNSGIIFSLSNVTKDEITWSKLSTDVSPNEIQMPNATQNTGVSIILGDFGDCWCLRYIFSTNIKILSVHSSLSLVIDLLSPLMPTSGKTSIIWIISSISLPLLPTQRWVVYATSMAMLQEAKSSFLLTVPFPLIAQFLAFLGLSLMPIICSRENILFQLVSPALNLP